MQQLTCKIDLSGSFYYLFFSFVPLELKPFVLKGKSWGKNSEKVPKSVKKCEDYETILPFSCCPLAFLGFFRPKLGKGHKGFHKRGIHDQGDFWKFLLETTVDSALKLGKFDLFMDTPCVETPLALPEKLRLNFAGDFLADLLGLFLEKNRAREIHPKIHSKIQIRIWECRGENPHCRKSTLQGSGLDLSTV